MAWINFFGDRVRIKDIFLRNGKCLADVFYPVGSIYISAASTSPADMFGGTWKQIKGRFLLGADDTHTVGSTGGQSDLGIQPSGNEVHGFSLTTSGNGFYDRAMVTKGSYTGSNIPPYFTVYMWQRTA